MGINLNQAVPGSGLRGSYGFLTFFETIKNETRNIQGILAKPENTTAAGPREERGKELGRKYGIKSTMDNSTAPSHADVVVLSVKPQRLSEVMKGLKGIRPDALILSIIAGANIKKISTGLKHKAVVRSMPNTPGQIGEGITVWTSSKEVTEEQQETAQRDHWRTR